MKLQVPKKVGCNTYNFEVEGDTLHDVLMEAKKLSFRDVKCCGLCDSELLYLTAYVTREDKYEYTKVACAKCGGSVTFGQVKKDPSVFFLRRNDDKSLKWEADERTAPTPKPAPRADFDEEMPF